MHEHGGVVVDVVHLDDEPGGALQGPVVCPVDDEGCQLILCLLLPVQPLEGVHVPAGLLHLEDGVGEFALDDVLGVLVPHAGCDLGAKCGSGG